MSETAEVTIFEKIINKEIPCELVFENDVVIAFKDINPQAKEHYLFIHKEKTLNINAMAFNNPEQLEQLFSAIAEFTKSNDLEKDGFRIVTNINRNGGQTVFYTHLHVLGGEALGQFG
jgi:histidine triad (HIT) family protein